MSSECSGELITKTFAYDGGRLVSAYVPSEPAEAVVFAGDGQLVVPWGRNLTGPPTLLMGVHRSPDETQRLHEYSPEFDPGRFAAHEAFLLGEVRHWTQIDLGVSLPPERTAAFGVSAGGELALALGLRHPDIFGVVMCASPGGGYRPPAALPGRLPRTYLLAGRQEPFFLDNARRWATTLQDAGADAVMQERDGSHGDAFWRDELPLMVAWAFSR